MNVDTVRRIAERGLKHAQRENDSVYCDIFQHMLDEIQRIKLYRDRDTIRAFRKFAEKVQDPKHKSRNEIHVFADIATEIAEELEIEAILNDDK